MQKFLQVMLLVIAAFFYAEEASALTVMEKTGGNLIGDPAITSAGNMAVIGYQSGKVKFVRNVKYVDSTQTQQAEYNQVRGNRAGTAFTCPGYYYIRTYSDLAGTKLNGTIRLYIAASDLPNAAGNCAAITPPAATPVAPAAVKKINVTHPRPTVVEPKNNIKIENVETKIVEIANNDNVFIQKDDPGKSEFVAPFPEPPPPQPQTEGFLFLNPYYNPLSDESFADYFAPPWFYFDTEGYDNATFFMNNYDFSSNYAMPQVISNAAAAQGYGPFQVGTLNASGYTPPLVLDQNLQEQACVDAGGMILYKEQFGDVEVGVSQNTPVCVSMQEYENCQIVRYFAAYKHHWSEQSDPDFSEINDPVLRNLLSFDLSYCQHNKLTNDTKPVDPFIDEDVERAAYTITECAAEDDYSCDEMLPDPYFSPTAAPVEPGDGGVVEPVNPGGGGGSPRRR